MNLFQSNRRGFLSSMTACISAFKSYTAQAEVDALENCTEPENLVNRSEVIADHTSVQIDGTIPTVQYWINGAFIGDSRTSDHLRRANIAILIRHDQNDSLGFVERVVLAYDESAGESREIAVQYFNQADQIDQGFPPYIIMNNVFIPNDHKKIELRYLVKGKGKEKVIRKVFPSGDTINRSRFRNSKNTNLTIPDHLENHITSSEHKGVISTPIEISDGIMPPDLDNYRFTAYFEVLQDNHFKLIVQLPDLGYQESEENYVRHIILTDPVGRIIAYNYRQFPTKKNNTVTLSTEQNQTNQDNINPGSQIYSAEIKHCPYVTVLLETPKALFQQIISLR